MAACVPRGLRPITRLPMGSTILTMVPVQIEKRKRKKRRLIDSKIQEHT